jgi:phenylacetate-CoA ligase
MNLSPEPSARLHALYDSIYPILPIPIQNLACTAAGYARFRARFNSHFFETLTRLEDSRQWQLDRLQALQRKRLDRLIERARTEVPYYRDLAPPSYAKDSQKAIQETLSAIPPLEKATYRDEPLAFLARDIDRSKLSVSQTSGTTGTALRLWSTPETLAEEYATVWRLRLDCDVCDPSDPNVTFNGNIIVPFQQGAPPYWRRSAYDKRTLFSVYHMTPGNLRYYVQALHALPTHYVEGYPSAIHLMARALLAENAPLPEGSVKAIFTSSESLLAFQRDSIEKAFGAPVRDRYGVSEKAVSTTECRAGRLHVDMEFCIVEVEVTEESDLSETGPLLVTGLATDATPFIRYRIGDVGTRAKSPCPCGRFGDSFLAVDGRIEDYVLTPDGRLVGRLDHVFKQQLEVAEAQITQTVASSINVLVVPRDGYSEASEKRLVRDIRSRLGPTIEIRVQSVDSISREPNGKFRAVKSEVGRIEI